MAATVSRSSSNTWTWLLVIAGAITTVVVGYILLVEAPPPRKIVMASGGKEGAYFRFASRYAELLKQEGITLEILNTKGSVENLKLLRDEDSDVMLALVQSGVAERTEDDRLEALCSLYREPLWIFYRGDETVDRLTQLAGKRIAIGPEGSGTRSIALQLLQANEMNESSAEFLSISGSEAAEALKSGDIDAAFFVAGINAAYIQQLVKYSEVKLAELAQTDAYLRRFRFLSTVTINAGLLDLKNNLPERDIVLMAPTATLVAHDSLHPALIPLLLKMATKIHRSGDLLSNSNEFPSASFVDLPLSEDAERFFKFGPPVLQRILPFWLASLVDRMKLMIIPLLVLLMPLFRLAPPLVRWRTRRKIYLWYSTLREIDQQSIHGMSFTQARDAMDKLASLEQQIGHVGVPLSYMEEYYNLRLHLDLVRSHVEPMLNPA